MKCVTAVSLASIASAVLTFGLSLPLLLFQFGAGERFALFGCENPLATERHQPRAGTVLRVGSWEVTMNRVRHLDFDVGKIQHVFTTYEWVLAGSMKVVRYEAQLTRRPISSAEKAAIRADIARRTHHYSGVTSTGGRYFVTEVRPENGRGLSWSSGIVTEPRGMYSETKFFFGPVFRWETRSSDYTDHSLPK